jgi:hypothetical protein
MEESTMSCPKCSFEQTKSDECIKCGIIISKYIEMQGKNLKERNQVHVFTPHNCSVCGAKIADLYNERLGWLCLYCFNETRERESKGIKPGQIECPACKHIQLKELICSNCGVEFSKININCPACNEKIPFSLERCTNCGVDVWKVKKEQKSVSISIPVRESTVNCPKCGSASVGAIKKGFGLGKAILGNAVLGPVGLVGGLVGSNKVQVVCLKCGHKWKP